MLSDNLRALHGRIANYVHDGVQLTPEGVSAVCDVLNAAIDDARALENSVVPEHVRGARVALPRLYGDNVVPLVLPARRRHPITPDGGQAA